MKPFEFPRIRKLFVAIRMTRLMDYVQILQIATLRLELDRNAAEVNVVVAQAMLQVFFLMDD